MIRTTNVRGGRIDLTGAKCVSREIYERWTRRQVPEEGDVVLTREAPLGEVGILRKHEPVFLGQRLVAYRVNRRKAIPEFLLYSLMGADLQAQIHALGSGSTVEHMRVPDAKKLLVATPPLDIQRRIAGILSAYDDLMEVNTRRIAILEEMARRLFDEWFVRALGKLPILGDRLDEWSLPQGWRFQSLAERATIVMGQSPPSSLYNSESRGLPFHQGVTDFDGFFHHNRAFVDGADQPRIAEWDDILFSVRAPVARIALALNRMIFGRGLAAIRPSNSCKTFMFCHLRATFPRPDMIGNGAIYKAVTKKEVYSIPIVWPGDKHVNQFERHAAPMWSQIKYLYLANRNLCATRDLLLPKLISGEIDVLGAEREAGRVTRQLAAE